MAANSTMGADGTDPSISGNWRTRLNFLTAGGWPASRWVSIKIPLRFYAMLTWIFPPLFFVLWCMKTIYLLPVEKDLHLISALSVVHQQRSVSRWYLIARAPILGRSLFRIFFSKIFMRIFLIGRCPKYLLFSIGIRNLWRCVNILTTIIRPPLVTRGEAWRITETGVSLIHPPLFRPAGTCNYSF